MPKSSGITGIPPVNSTDGKLWVLRNRNSRPIVFMFVTWRSISLQFAVGTIRIDSHPSVRSRDGEISESQSEKAHAARGRIKDPDSLAADTSPRFVAGFLFAP